jgi:hypothetical protein
MSRTARARYGAALTLAIAGLLGTLTPSALAQVPYGPYSMTRAQFNQYAPVYYPRLSNYVVPPFYGMGMYPRYGYGRRFYRPYYPMYGNRYRVNPYRGRFW